MFKRIRKYFKKFSSPQHLPLCYKKIHLNYNCHNYIRTKYCSGQLEPRSGYAIIFCVGRGQQRDCHSSTFCQLKYCSIIILHVNHIFHFSLFAVIFQPSSEIIYFQSRGFSHIMYGHCQERDKWKLSTWSM